MILRTQKTILPGFKMSLGFTLTYLSLIVLIPLSCIIIKTSVLTFDQFWHIVTSPRVVASYKLTFFASFIAASINAIVGLLIAWVLVRYPFPGKRFFDAMIDLPFALPTAVAGIVLTTLYGKEGWVGSWLHEHGISVTYTPLGVIVALTFIGLPFVVRTLQPVLEDLDPEMEEAASSLGASRLKTFTAVIFPHLLPALLTGFSLAFARALGEYGSVIFISGNKPLSTEITSLLIMTKLDQFDYPAATAIALVMLIASFLLLFLINLLQAWQSRRSA